MVKSKEADPGSERAGDRIQQAETAPESLKTELKKQITKEKETHMQDSTSQKAAYQNPGKNAATEH